MQEIQIENSINIDTALPNPYGDQENIRIEFIDTDVILSLNSLTADEQVIYTNFTKLFLNKQVKIENYSLLAFIYRETNDVLIDEQIVLNYNTTNNVIQNKINEFITLALSKKLIIF